MSKKALELLNANPASQSNGFFLQIEGASIDKQDHAGNACGQIGETDDFDQAISYVLQNVDLSDTLVIVTADHAHTSQILTAQPAYALSTVLKTADGNNMSSPTAPLRRTPAMRKAATTVVTWNTPALSCA